MENSKNFQFRKLRKFTKFSNYHYSKIHKIIKCLKLFNFEKKIDNLHGKLSKFQKFPIW